MISLPAALWRVPDQVEDRLRHSRRIRELLAHTCALAAPLVPSLPRRYQLTLRALEATENPSLRHLLVERLNRWGLFEQRDLLREMARSSPRYQSQFRRRMTLNRSIILKAPQADGEKGVLLMTFEYNWARLFLRLSAAELGWMSDRFNFILSTSWSPTDYTILALAVASVPGHLFVQSCNYSECEAIETFHPRLQCLKTLPCDWIQPSGFEVKPTAARTIDLLMVANWGKFKRHWEFFQVLSELPAHLKVVLVGQHSGRRNKAFIERMARRHGVRQQLTVHESLPIQDVAAMQSEAKVSVIFTRREGCCVAAVESLMAGCALGMREDAHVGPKSYINARTGRRLRPGHLAEDLARLLAEAETMDPRNWCIENASPARSWKLLNQQLRDYELGHGRPWKQDIAMPQWRPHPTFANVDEQNQLKPLYNELEEKFPAVFAPTLWGESWR